MQIPTLPLTRWAALSRQVLYPLGASVSYCVRYSNILQSILRNK